MPKRANTKLNPNNYRSSINSGSLKGFLKLLVYKFTNIFSSKRNNRAPSEQEEVLLHNISKFGDKTVENIMLTRNSIVALPANTTLEALSEVINKFSHTRIFIYEDTIDNITGFVHIKDIFKLVTKKQAFNLNKIIRKHIVAAGAMKIIDLFKEMQAKCIHIAIVINEYGDTAGMVTIENILEEIFGNIDDEHDNVTGDKNFKILNSNTIVANARANIEVLESVLKVRLKKHGDDFETIGGLVLATAGSVPAKGTKINILDKVEVEVIESSARTLKKVKLKLNDSNILDSRT